jgi:hypothetical protein
MDIWGAHGPEKGETMPSRLQPRGKFPLLSIALAALLAASACRRQREGDAVSVRIQWLDQAQFAGLYVANAKGFFKQRHLTVSVEPGGPDVSPVPLVASGSNDFGVSPATDVIQARSNGVPVVAIATIFQKNPVVFFSMQAKNIKTPRDFVGHTVGLKYGMEIEYYYHAMMQYAGVDTSKVKEVPMNRWRHRNATCPSTRFFAAIGACRRSAIRYSQRNGLCGIIRRELWRFSRLRLRVGLTPSSTRTKR